MSYHRYPETRAEDDPRFAVFNDRTMLTSPQIARVVKRRGGSVGGTKKKKKKIKILEGMGEKVGPKTKINKKKIKAGSRAFLGYR